MRITRIERSCAMALVYTLCASMCLLNLSAHADDKLVTAEIFKDNVVHFTPDVSGRYDTDKVKAADNGRAILRTVELPRFDRPVRITAHLVVKPVPQDELSVVDHWDRAGSIRLESDRGAPLEIVKFITAYGGRIEHDVDVTELAPRLQGKCLISAFIDTWVSPAWQIDFSLSYEPDTGVINATWVSPLMLEDSFNDEDRGGRGVEVEVNVPDGLRRVMLEYYVSGHCTDGRDADEFVTKDNVIIVDDFVVYRFRPWRDDCKQFRAINPYCKKWSDGSWSSDFSRSGWCPGDKVLPLELDLTDHLTAGRHRVRFVIENMRPKDRDGNFGYWRVSSRLIGYDRLPGPPGP